MLLQVRRCDRRRRCPTSPTGARSGHRRGRPHRRRRRAIRDDADPSPLLDNFLDGDPAARRGSPGPPSAGAGSSTGPGPTSAAGDDDFVEVELGRGPRPRGRRAARGCAAEHGNEAIFGGSYGWASAGRFHHAQSQLHRFLNCIGGYTFSVGSYSLGAIGGAPAPRRRRRPTRCCAGRRRGRRSSPTPTSSSPSAA